MANVDIGHTSLIHLIREYFNRFDLATIGALRMMGTSLAKECTSSLEELEGIAEEIKPGIMVLQKCPFSDTIASYQLSAGGLPSEFKTITTEANNLGGAWVSPFCGIHQAMRKERIGDSFLQLACRSGSGAVHIADQDVLSKEEVEEALKTNACIYAR